MACKSCASKIAHHHIVLKDGEVSTIWYVTADAWWYLKYWSYFKEIGTSEYVISEKEEDQEE